MAVLSPPINSLPLHDHKTDTTLWQSSHLQQIPCHYTITKPTQLYGSPLTSNKFSTTTRSQNRHNFVAVLTPPTNSLPLHDHKTDTTLWQSSHLQQILYHYTITKPTQLCGSPLTSNKFSTTTRSQNRHNFVAVLSPPTNSRPLHDHKTDTTLWQSSHLQQILYHYTITKPTQLCGSPLTSNKFSTTTRSQNRHNFVAVLSPPTNSLPLHDHKTDTTLWQSSHLQQFPCHYTITKQTQLCGSPLTSNNFPATTRSQNRHNFMAVLSPPTNSLPLHDHKTDTTLWQFSHLQQILYHYTITKPTQLYGSPLTSNKFPTTTRSQNRHNFMAVLSPPTNSLPLHDHKTDTTLWQSSHLQQIPYHYKITKPTQLCGSPLTSNKFPATTRSQNRHNFVAVLSPPTNSLPLHDHKTDTTLWQSSHLQQILYHYTITKPTQLCGSPHTSNKFPATTRSQNRHNFMAVLSPPTNSLPLHDHKTDTTLWQSSHLQQIPYHYTITKPTQLCGSPLTSNKFPATTRSQNRHNFVAVLSPPTNSLPLHDHKTDTTLWQSSHLQQIPYHYTITKPTQLCGSPLTSNKFPATTRSQNRHNFVAVLSPPTNSLPLHNHKTDTTLWQSSHLQQFPCHYTITKHHYVCANISLSNICLY